ncbi:unnamed protein product, partial [Mesorhabditis belari]|uniref:Regulator of microtubule dynamics protein 1 n=1 Tax=Mesorhabditis belari TaxID=2138241 RepID=A0AAF3EAR8_9BILA
MSEFENLSYEELKKKHEAGNNEPELLWRLAESCYRKANALDAKDTNGKKTFILEGREFGRKAVEQCPEGNIQVLKWAAILTGTSTDYLGTKERIEQAYVLKGLLDKAIALNGNDSTLLHLRGRYAFGIANLSWLERKAASAFFATPPEATIDEALADFVACHAIRPDFIENNVYAARCLISKKEYEKAVNFMNEALALPADDENEKALQEEARGLIKKYGK